MTKRSKITLLSLLALIMAFGLILTGCPDAAGGSNVDVPADVVKVTSVEFKNGVAGTVGELTFIVELPGGEYGGTWDAGAINTAAARPLGSAGSLANYFDIDVPYLGATSFASYTTLIAAVTTPTKLTVTVKQASATATYISRVSVGLVQSSSANIKDLITNKKALPIASASKTWKYSAGPLISVKNVEMTDAATTADAGKAVVTLELNKGTWKTGLARADLKALFTSIGDVVATSTIDILAYTAGGEPSGAGSTTAVYTLEAASGITRYGQVVALLKGTYAVPATLVDGGGSGAPLIDLDLAEGKSATVTLAKGSQGTAGTKSIYGLDAAKKYLILEDDTKWYVSATGGVMTEINALNATTVVNSAVFGSSITVLKVPSATKKYDVYEYTTHASAITADGTLAGSKNAVAFLSGNGAITASAGLGSTAANTTLIVVTDTAIVTSGTTQANNAVPAASADIIKTTKTWTFSNYAAMGTAKVNFATNTGYIKITPCNGVTAFTLTLAN